MVSGIIEDCMIILKLSVSMQKKNLTKIMNTGYIYMIHVQILEARPKSEN